MIIHCGRLPERSRDHRKETYEKKLWLNYLLFHHLFAVYCFFILYVAAYMANKVVYKNIQYKCKYELDSMRWFSHRRTPSPPGGHTMVSSVATCCVRPTAHALLCIVNVDDSAAFHCLSLVTLTIDLWPWQSNSGEIFVHYVWRPSFIIVRLIVRCSEVIVRTNKLTDKLTNRLQTPLKTSTSLRYATPVGNNCDIKHTHTHTHTHNLER